MNFTQSFKLALKSLKTSKMRAFLTMLGIIIGVGAVIVILSLGNGMTNMMNSQFEKMGSNLIQVMTYGRGTGGTRDVDVEDLYELVDKYPQYLTGVTPYVSASAKVRYQTDDYDRTSVYGVSEAFFKEDTKGTMQGETLAEGRFLSYIDVDRHQNVCVIGDYLAQAAFRGDALGKTISLSGVPYTVIGVLSKSGDSSEGSADDVIYIPYENAQRMGTGTMMMGTDEMFLLTSTSRDTASAAKGIVEKRLYKTYQSSDYYMVMTSAEMMDAMNTMMNTMMIVLVAIAAISLLVGGSFREYWKMLWSNDHPVSISTDHSNAIFLMNVGIYGLFILAYYNIVGETFNGVTFGILFCMLSCCNVGANPRNVFPIILGYVAAAWLFEALEEDDPSHIAVREYKIYKQAAGKTAKSILIPSPGNTAGPLHSWVR